MYSKLGIYSRQSKSSPVSDNHKADTIRPQVSISTVGSDSALEYT